MTDQKQKPAPLEEWQEAAIRAVPDSLVRAIADDFRRGPAAPSSLAGPTQSEKPRPPSGGTAKLTVPYVNHVDAIGESFARRDRAIAHQQAMELAWTEKLLGRRNPNKVATEYNPYSRERMGFDDDE
jgi:hypothetical protein